ncbi:unnamed protein product [Penicillium nalgiovense]|uniref:Derlin n=1 Tax=Penicillium nalgiovense TaxID=60175 RepID=A0A9W4MLQ0_PENNA|nr:unnamed protein product [Penicillium nalgiovense]CAG7937533.1 unnamed protein product [Penicillium nalgiovense]CAG7939415.1 unnamed protein product [Penicillium nalgiovense]CAG7941168.1 unnamed protein product [Penicillium nalgiovense]CAG7956657.1 unnamed protein product [Penicillium nalgiovense]
MDVFWAAPPVTRTLTALTLVQSALMYGGLLSFYWAPFLPNLIFSWRPQIYRLVTPFLLTGPKLGFLFDLYIMYHYGSAAEKSMAPGEFLIYLLFVAFSIMLNRFLKARESTPASVQHHHNSQNTGVVQVWAWWDFLRAHWCDFISRRYRRCPTFLYTSSILFQYHLHPILLAVLVVQYISSKFANFPKLTAGGYLGAAILLSPLTMAFVYTFSQTNRGTKTRFWFIDIPVVFLPYAMLLVTMVSNGWDAALVESMGILAAHTYDFLTRIYPTFGGGRNFIAVPGFVERYFTKHDPNSGYRGYGTASRAPRPAGQPSSASASGSTWGSWTSSGSWNGRGAGRRLG